MITVASMPFSVFSGRPADLEAGFAPFLEAKFATRSQADEFAAGWNALSDNVIFWVEG